jgi:hypothetical protein
MDTTMNRQEIGAATQAVLDAFYEGWNYQDDITPSQLAAAIRTAAKYVRGSTCCPGLSEEEAKRWDFIASEVCLHLRVIAYELRELDAVQVPEA